MLSPRHVTVVIICSDLGRIGRKIELRLLSHREVNNRLISAKIAILIRLRLVITHINHQRTNPNVI